MKVIKVNGIELSVKEWRGLKVLTAGDINRVLGKSKASSWVGRLRDRCKAAGYPLKENADYFKVSKKEAKAAFQLKAVREEITLYTASGYNKLMSVIGENGEAACMLSLLYYGVPVGAP